MLNLIYQILVIVGLAVRVLGYISLLIIVAIVLSILLGIYTPYMIELLTGKELKPDEAGQFGDQFGFANAVISALAFGGLIWTIHYQRKDLQEQREEFASLREATEEQIALQNTELQSTLEHAETAAFEQMFFRMLELRESIISNISAPGPSTIARLGASTPAAPSPNRVGRTAIEWYTRGVLLTLREEKDNQPVEGSHSISLASRRLQLADKYNDWYRDGTRASALGHYFRLTYSVFRMIHERPGLSEKQRYGYARLVRAQMSDSELWLLFCNCISHLGWERMMPFANRYHLFDNLLFTSEHFQSEDRYLTTSRVANQDEFEGSFELYDPKTGLANGQEQLEPGRGFGTPTNDL